MKNRLRISTSATLALLVGLLVLGGQWASHLIAADVLGETIRQREIDKIKTIANLMKELIEQHQDEARATARTLATDHTVTEAMRHLATQRVDALEQRLGEVFDMNEVQTLEVVDSNEKLLYRAQDAQYLGNVAANWGVAEVLAGSKGLFSSAPGNDGVVIQAIEPIVAEGKVVGALTAGVALNQEFWDQMSQQFNAQMLLLDHGGNSIGQSKKMLSVQIDTSNVNAAFQSKIPVFQIDPVNHRSSVYLPLLIVDDAYVMLVQLDSSDAYQLLEEGRLRSLVSGVLTLLVSLAIGFLALQWVLRPLHQLRRRALQSAQELTGQAIVETQSDEVRSVVRVLDTLTERLVQRNAELGLEKDRAEAANRAKSQFLSTMSHEIRTPLNGVLGLTELLQHTPLNTEQSRFVASISTAGKALHGLLSDILDLAKIEEGQLLMEQVDFDPAQLCGDLADVYRNMATMRDLAFSSDFSELQCDWASGDPTRLRQVLGNLLGNALKFTERGQIGFSAETIPAPAGDARLWCRFTITDSGIGLTPEAVAGLFQRFSQADASTTRRFGGSGLGLSICKHLVEIMGGQIHVQSTPGQGSCFWFDLPLGVAQSSRPATSANDAALTAGKPAQGMRVLVAEDNMINQMVIRSLLERRGASVVVVEDGLQAIEQLKTSAFDLVFMDCQMPVMDGFEATRQIRAWEATQRGRLPIPIIALTANAMASDREECFAAGMTDFATKPIKGDVLDQIFQTYRA